MKDKFVALITARGGSKGLPKKNIRPLNGIPLIAWTIQSALGCSKVSHVFVSTDDEEIALISTEYGADVINRPSELASDSASSIDVIQHAIDWLNDSSLSYENMVLLQPTSPLRTASHLDEALTLFAQKDADFVISVFEPHHTPIKSYIENKDGTIEGLYSDDAPYLRRQDLPRAFLPNGAIYAFSKREFILNGTFPRKKVYPYIMSATESDDIDSLADFLEVEKKMKELIDE